MKSKDNDRPEENDNDIDDFAISDFDDFGKALDNVSEEIYLRLRNNNMIISIPEIQLLCI